MKQSEWNEGLNNLDSDIIENYIAQKEAYEKKIKKPTAWTRYIAVAACLCLVVGIVAVSLILNRGDDPIIPEGDLAIDNVEGDSDLEYTTEVESGENTTFFEDAEETTVTPETENNEPYEIKVDDYTLLKNENGCYLTFDDISKYQNNSSSGGAVVANVEFKSLKEFKDTVTKGLLTDDQKNIITRFSNNNNIIQTCDFNNLYEPIVPKECNLGNIYWSGTSYSFDISLDSGAFGGVTYLSKEDYDILYELYENFFNNDLMTITSVEEINGEIITNYKTSSAVLKNIRYATEVGNRTVIIEKEYCIESAYSDLLGFIADVPYSITLYCIEGNKYYRVSISDLKYDPSYEWLLQFGLKRYVENDHEVM